MCHFLLHILNIYLTSLYQCCKTNIFRKKHASRNELVKFINVIGECYVIAELRKKYSRSLVAH